MRRRGRWATVLDQEDADWDAIREMFLAAQAAGRLTEDQQVGVE